MCATCNIVWHVKHVLYFYIIIIIIIITTTTTTTTTTILLGVLLPLYGICMVVLSDEFCMLPESGSFLGGGPVSWVIQSSPLPYSSDDRGTTVHLPYYFCLLQPSCIRSNGLFLFRQN